MDETIKAHATNFSFIHKNIPFADKSAFLPTVTQVCASVFTFIHLLEQTKFPLLSLTSLPNFLTPIV